MYSNNYNYYPQSQQQSIQYSANYLRPPVSTALKGRPVSSLEEARAQSIDFDGSVFYFPDVANKKIYSKQINIDGTATLNVYELKELPIENPIVAPPTKDYITREEFDAVIAQLKSTFTSPQPIAQTATPQEIIKSF